MGVRGGSQACGGEQENGSTRLELLRQGDSETNLYQGGISGRILAALRKAGCPRS